MHEKRVELTNGRVKHVMNALETGVVRTMGVEGLLCSVSKDTNKSLLCIWITYLPDFLMYFPILHNVIIMTELMITSRRNKKQINAKMEIILQKFKSWCCGWVDEVSTK